MDDYRYDNSLDIEFKLFVTMSQGTFDKIAEMLPHPVIRSLLSGNYFFDAYLCNISDYDNPDSINIIIASDTESRLNGSLLSGIDGDTVSIYGINKDDSFYCTGINRVSRLIGTRSNRCVYAKVAFSVEKTADSGNIPYDVSDIVFRLPNIKEKGSTDKIKHWDEYLKINEQIAKEEERVISYSLIKKCETRSKIIFEVDGTSLVSGHIGSSVQLVTGTAKEDNETVYLGDIIGQISHFTAKEITVTLEPQFQGCEDDFDKMGLLHITKHGDLVQIRRLRRGLQRFSRGQAVNPYLDLFMFNSRKARNIENKVTLNEDRLLLKRLNAEQKAAVEGALAAEDLFLIQGPPGTGKTTAIAEICYQNALEGKRTLIASQTNLAVDNVLSRLVHDPKIRALRKGSAGSVQEEGLPFTEDKVVATWLKNTAESCTNRLERQKNIVSRVEEIEEKLKIAAEAHKKFIAGMGERSKLLGRVKMLKKLLDIGERDLATFSEDVSAYRKDRSSAVVRRAEMFELGEYSFDKQQIKRLKDVSGDIEKFNKDVSEYQAMKELAENSLQSAAEWKAEAEKLLDKEVSYEEKSGNILTKTDIMMMYGGLADMLSRQIKSKPKKLSAIFGFAAGWKDDTIKLLSGIYQFIKDCEATCSDINVRLENAGKENDIETKINTAAEILEGFVKEYTEKLDEIRNDTSEAEKAAEEIKAETSAARRTVTEFDDMIEYERQDIETAIFKEDLEEYYKSLWHDEYTNAKAYVTLVEKWISRINLQNPQDYEAFKKIYIDNANVIGVTCSGSGTAEFEKDYPQFDVAIIDEVSKATPPELILPVLKAKKLVLVGDHKQLPPMIGSDTYDEVAEKLGLEETEHMKVSLFEELYVNAPDELKVMLSRQYRMHSDIMDTINRFYSEDGGLVCGIDNALRAHGCAGGFINENDHALWVDVPRDDTYRELRSPKNFSYSNRYEAEAIKNILLQINENLRNNNFDGKKEIGVITFYSNQVSLLEDELMGSFSEKIEKISLRIGSVDKFQGIEKPVIICSFVRNNDFGDIGFAKDPRRINVALSRAQELLVIVGCKDLFCRHNEDYDSIYKMIEEKGGMRNAVDFICG